MEQRSGIFKSIGGILRLLLGVLIVVIVAFLLIRFIGGREAADNAEKAAHPVAVEQSDGEDKTTDTTTTESKSSSDKTNSQETENTGIPSGIDDAHDNGQTVPATGAGTEVIYTTFISALITFGLFELVQLFSKSRSNE